MAARAKAQAFIDENPVAVFSKSYCPYCKASKSLLSSLGANYEVMELDKLEDGPEIQAALKEITGQTTVPNIFIGREHIGGNSELQSLKKNLGGMLQKAGAL